MFTVGLGRVVTKSQRIGKSAARRWCESGTDHRKKTNSGKSLKRNNKRIKTRLKARCKQLRNHGKDWRNAEDGIAGGISKKVGPQTWLYYMVPGAAPMP